LVLTERCGGRFLQPAVRVFTPSQREREREREREKTTREPKQRDGASNVRKIPLLLRTTATAATAIIIHGVDPAIISEVERARTAVIIFG
jgi:hypothetical protein